MSLEFFGWLLGLSVSNLFITGPLYLITSVIINKVVKDKDNISLAIFSVNLGIIMVILVLLESFTITNIITMFLESLLFTWIGNKYWLNNREQDKTETL